MSIDKAQRLFLFAMSFGLFPVALSYGLLPERSLPLLYGITDPDLPTRHVFRAVMGLYLGMICFWLLVLTAGLSRCSWPICSPKSRSPPPLWP
jgi:hypothetical protein